MPTTLYENRPSARVGVVEVQKLVVCFLRFCFGSRDPLRGSAWSRCKHLCKNSRVFTISAVLARSAWSRCENYRFFYRCLRRLRDLLRESALEFFLRLLLFELVLGSCLVVRAPALGTGGSRVRFPPGPRAGFASCAEQLA